jgi:Tfp pilus assembly protein PilZ
MRDVSAKGVFFYSDFSPSLGDELDFVLEFLGVPDKVRFHFKGRVIRIEHPAPGSAPGVAVAFRSNGDKSS